MKNSPVLSVLFVSMALFAGCERPKDDSHPEQVETNAVRVQQKQNELVTVDGKTLHYADVEAEADLRMSLAGIRRRKMSQAALVRMKTKIFKQAIPHYVQTRVFGKYALENGICIRPADREEFERRMAESYQQKSFAALKSRISERQVRILEQGVEEELLVNAAKARIIEEAKISIADEAVTNELVRMHRMNQIAAATNALVYANASNIWRKIQSRNLTFDEAVSDYSESEDASARGAWVTAKVSQMKDEPRLVRAICNLRTGDFTPPIEVDNGLCIIRVDSRKIENPNDEETFELSRIYLRLAQTWDEVSADEMRRAMREKAEQDVISGKLKELIGKSQVIQHVKKPTAKGRDDIRR